MFFEQTNKKNNVRLVWLHGWGVDHTSLYAIESLFANDAENVMPDLSGFGKTPAPDKVYSTKDYADEIAELIKSLPKKPTYIIGHSFGCRVALQLAANYPHLMKGIVLIAGAGLKYKHSVWFKMYAFILKYLSKIFRHLPFMPKLNLGSADYQNTKGIMRKIFVKTINENLAKLAETVAVPTCLIYGTKDTATPVYFGKIYHQAIKNSKLYVLDNATHYSLLFEYKYQVQNLIYKFLAENK